MAKMGNIPWNKGKTDTPPRSKEVRLKISLGMKGKNTWMKGRKQSEISNKKRSLTLVGRKKTKEHAKRIGEGRKGFRHSKETRAKLSGINNHGWKGGKRVVTLLIRDMYEYRQWRSDVFTRDDFTCQFCWLRGGKLNADHYPKTLSSIIYENGLLNQEQARACSELWNLNNGRTLCEACHRKTPTWGLKLKH